MYVTRARGINNDYIYNGIPIIMISVGPDRFGGGKRSESVAEAQKAHVLFATDVGRPQSSGVATLSDGK